MRKSKPKIYELPAIEDSIYVDMDTYVKVEDDSTYDYYFKNGERDDKCTWAEDEYSYYWSDETTGVDIADATQMAEWIDNYLLLDVIPDDPGFYHVTGEVFIPYIIHDVDKQVNDAWMSEEYGYDEDSFYVTEDADVNVFPDDISCNNLNIVKLN